MQVTVKGASDVVTNLTSIDLDPVNLDGLKSNKTWNISLPEMENASVDPDSVDISAVVEKE